MEEIIAFFKDFNIWTTLIKLTLAVIFGGVIGLERGRQGRAAGMRTYILVCVGAALTTLIGMYVSLEMHIGNDPLRIGAQVISGIGFLGVGTILIKGRFQITGLTTAAGLWVAAALGLALGAGFYSGAIIAFVLTIMTITLAHKLEYRMYKRKNTRFGIYVEISSDTAVSRTVAFLKDNFKAMDVQVTTPRSGTVGNVGIEANIVNTDLTTSPETIAAKLEEREDVIFALESI
ncbi:MAG: MgtC/SapB family protein [Clostridia bacterium]|nr:MgtC/SapB family protein [Clostridia bacterium]